MVKKKEKTSHICLRCRKKRKRKDYQFCSKKCTDIAAKKAPQLYHIPRNHVMFKDVAKHFRKTWLSRKKRPAIVRMYLITWTKKLRSSFDGYRSCVSKKWCIKKPKEVKRFRAESRRCRLGDPKKSKKLCKRKGCHLCRAIATGFASSLNDHRKMVLTGKLTRVRFGGGIYLAPASSTATSYAKNISNGSKYKAVLATRVVLGRPQLAIWDERFRLRPTPPFDSVEAHPPGGGDTELILYNSDAVRPAYLLILK